MLYRGYQIDWERDHKGEIRTVIIDPNGDGWFCDGDPEDVVCVKRGSALLSETK
jgi:hypothetical protein